MRTLLPLPLEAMHTEDVEALPSYLCRLAWVHGVTPSGLLKHLVRGAADEVAVKAALYSGHLAALVRPNATAALFARLLASSKSESLYVLQRSTFDFLSPALARTPRGYVPQLRWCPACFREQLLHTGTPFFKLVWFLRAVEACAAHHIKLRDLCPHCGRAPKPLRGWGAFETCPSCSGRLDVVTSSDVRVIDTEVEAVDLVSLVGEIAVAKERFPPGAASHFIAAVFDEAWRAGQEGDLWRKLPRDDCIRYCEPSEPITLSAARRLAFRLEVPIAELLRGGSSTSRSFNFAASCPLPMSMRYVHRGNKIDSAALVRQLAVFLDAGQEPQSLREVGRQLRVSVGAMRYHAPTLVAKLAKRYLQSRRTGQETQNLAVTNAVDAKIRSWPAGGGFPMAKKSLLRVLRADTGLPKEKLRRAIQTALQHQDS
jgi:hypothetical protein